MKTPSALDVVLSLRRRQQDAAESALAQALANMHAAQQMLETLRAELARIRTAPSAQRGELLHLPDVLFRTQRLRALEQSCSEADSVLATHRATVADRQAAYLNTRREREVVDTLLQQRATLARVQQGRQDAKVSDDLFLGRLALNSAPESTPL